MLHRSFKPAKCKTSLKLVAARLKLLKNKKEVVVKQLRRDLAQLLESGQDQTARIRVEHVVREENMMAAYELLEIFCELIAIRLPIIESQKNCPIDLKEAVTSVIFATPRCSDINELKDIQKQFTAKYGKEFVSAAIELRPDCGVNRNLIEKLSAKAPDGPTKLKILAAIAEEHNIKWEPKGFGEKESNHQEDSLSGPKTFENASKMHAETSNIQYSYYDRVSPNVHIHPENEVKKESPSNYQGNDAKSSFGFENFTTSDVGASAAPNPNLKSSGNGTDRMKSNSTHFEDHSPNFVDQKNWNMDFKDAASAAQAAAESAERASMAARVAAELSSQGKIVTQFSSVSRSSPVHTVKDEMPRKRTGSSFDSEASARGQKSNNFEDRSWRTQHEDVRAKERHNFTGNSERLSGDGNRSNNRSSQLSTAAFTSGSTKTSTKDGNRMNDQSTQSYDGYYQVQTPVDEDEKDDVDLSTLTERLRGDGRRSEPGSHSRSEKTSKDYVTDGADASRNFRRLPHSEDVDEFSVGSQSLKFEVEALEVTQDSWRTEEATDFEGERVTKLSPNADSYSHSSRSSSYSDREDDMEPNTQKLKHAVVGNPFAIVNEEKYHDDATTINESGSVLFDDYSSDGENPIFDVDKGPETISSVFSPDRKSTSLLSENINAPSPRKYRADLFDKDISEPHSSRDQSSTFVFSERLDDSDVRLHEDELPPAIFDDARPSPSESEEEQENFETDREDNSTSALKKSQFNFVREGSNKFGDLDDKKIQDRSRHSRVASADGSDGDNWPMNEHASVENSDGTTGLSLGKLTGGLKNKGYMRPPFVQNSSSAASSPKEAVAVETKKHPVSNPPKNWFSSNTVDDLYDQEVDSGVQRKLSTTASYRTSSKDEASASRKSLEDTAEKSSFSTTTLRKPINAAIDNARDNYVESRRQSGKLKEKSRRSLSGDAQLSDQAVLDSSTHFGLSSPPRQLSGSLLALNSQVKDSRAGRRSSSRESLSSHDSKQSEDPEEEVLPQVSGSKARYGAAVSRRTKGSPLKTDRSSILKLSIAPEEAESHESPEFSSRSSGIARKLEVPARSSDDDEIQEGTTFTKSSLRSSDGNDGYRSAWSERNASDDRRGSGRLPMGREAMERETQEPSKYTSWSSNSDRRSQVKPAYLSEEDENPEVREYKKSSIRSSYGTDRASSGQPQLGKESMGEGAQGPIKPSSQSSYKNRRSSEEAEIPKGEVVRKSSPRSSYDNEGYRGTRLERVALDDRGSSDRLRLGKESMGEGTRVPTQPSSRSSYTDRRSEGTAAYSSKEVESPERVAHKKSSSRSSDSNEGYRGSRQERTASDDKGNSDQLQLRKEAPVKPKSESMKSERPSFSPQVTSGSSVPGDSSKATRPSLEDTSRENSFNKASHVHPKLPDSDSFFAKFESLKQNRK